MSNETAENTDRELWRRKSEEKCDPDSFYQPSIHVTQDGKIGVHVKGTVYVKEIEAWAKLADLEPAPVYDTDDIADVLVRLYKDNEEDASPSDIAIAMSNKLKEWLADQGVLDIHDYREAGISIDLERTKYYEDKMKQPVTTEQDELKSDLEEQEKICKTLEGFLATERWYSRNQQNGCRIWVEKHNKLKIDNAALKERCEGLERRITESDCD